MSDQLVDPVIYGARPLGERDVPAPGGASAVPYSPPEAVPAVQAVQGSRLIQEGQADIAANNAEKAPGWASVGAAMTQWSPVLLHEFMTKPTFDWEEGYNPSVGLDQVDLPLDMTQEKYLLESKSSAERAYRLERLREQADAYKAMGDNGATAFAIAALDPGYLALDLASIGAGRMLRAAGAGSGTARLTAGALATAGAFGIGKMEQQVHALSDGLVFGMAMLNGAATTALFRGGKLTQADPEFPAQRLHEIADDLRARVDDDATVAAVRAEEAEVARNTVRDIPEAAPPRDVDAPTVPRSAAETRLVNERTSGLIEGEHYTAQSGRRMLRELESAADPMVATLARRVNELLIDDVQVRVVHATDRMPMGDGRAFYSPNEHAVYITRDTSPEIRLHEMSHALTSHKIEHGQRFPNSAHGAIVRELDVTFKRTQEVFEKYRAAGHADASAHTEYFLKDLHEFIAGVFSGQSEFTAILSRMKVAEDSSKSVLGSVVDSIRRILGMKQSETNALTHVLGLTEQLAKSPLNVTTFRGNGQGGRSMSMSYRLAPAGPMSTQQAKQEVSKMLANKISWSLHKTLASFGPTAKRVADLLVDDPLSMVGNSVTSQHRAIRADLQAVQIVYEDLLAKHMASQKAGLMRRIISPRESMAVQRRVEREVYMEMMSRNRASLDGVPHTSTAAPHIKEMADALDVVGAAALAELKRAGVEGADSITSASGYVNRRWDISKVEDIERALVAGGQSLDAARLSIRDSMSVAIQRANGWDAELASDVAKAILDRTRSKGYFEDSAIRTHAGADSAAEVRNLLTGSGLSDARIQRVLDVLTAKTDEAGKAASLKHRVDMHLDEPIHMPDGSAVTIADMLDTNIANLTERYLDSVSSQAAFARKGLTKPSDIAALRKELLESIPTVAERERAANLFDNTTAQLRGDPVGEEMPAFMRKLQAVTQMVGLRRAGLFQFTEYAPVMAKYGAGRTMAALFKELPFVRGMLSNPDELTHLNNVLSRNSSADLRIRPYVNRLEDNFEVPVSDAVQVALLQARQLVPYANALKFIQGHQARMVSNLVVDTFDRAAKGDAKAISALEHYGLESHIMGQIRNDIAAHGMDTAKWSASTWDSVRGPLTKMMDDAVLRNRTGEIPAFAQHTSTGKFIFTFRSFVLGAHNKVLAGTLNRGGFGGIGLLMLYQFPLTYAMTVSSNRIDGKKPMTEEDALGAAFSQMGSLGLFSEVAGIAFQNKQQFGSPGTIALDRVYKLGAAAAKGDAGAASAEAINSTPILSIILPVKAIGENLKGN